MDERGLTVDPFRGTDQELRWWETIGPTQKPSPYATESWTYYQTVRVETEILQSGLYRHQFVTLAIYDGKASDPGVSLSGPLDPILEARKGTRLGTLNYEVFLGQATITDWEHHNWHDATPIREAFRRLRNSLDSCILEIIVRDSPDSFWRDLGFVHPEKGSDILVYYTNRDFPNSIEFL